MFGNNSCKQLGTKKYSGHKGNAIILDNAEIIDIN